jgi:hypothetical protein
MANYGITQSMQFRTAIGALIAGGMFFAGPAGIALAAPGGGNSGDNGNHGQGNSGHGNGGANSGGGNTGGGNTGGGGSGSPGNPGNPGVPADPGGGALGQVLSGTLLWCAPAANVQAACPADPAAAG